MPLQYQRTVWLLHSEGHCNGVTTVVFSPNGQLLASGGMDGRVCIWSVPQRKILHVFSGKSAVLSLAWLESANNQLICGMEDGTIASLAITTESIQLDGFWAHQYPVERLAVCGTQLASGAHKEVKIWSQTSEGTRMSSWSQVGEVGTPPQSSYTAGCVILVTSLHWTSAPRWPSILLVTYMSHGIVTYDAKTLKRVHATSVPGYIADTSLSSDGRLLAISNMLTGFELFLMKAPAEIEPLFSFTQDVSAGRPLPVRFLHGDLAIIGGTSHGQVNIWDLSSRLKQSLRITGESTSCEQGH
ncbi:WD40-repeat-containing domain protein [Daedaleopsis nitida]|nr:WD40-repeat-containing domain protein [Daedaleopsis nitida]